MFAAKNCTRPTARLLNSSRCRTAPRGLRLQSTTAGSTGNATGSATSHVMAGLAGGGLVVVAGYAYYHFSGAKQAVASIQSMKQSFIQTKDTLAKNAPSPNAILSYLRSTAKTYAGFVPGASSYVDATFDTFDELAETHTEEFNKIIQGTYDEILPLVQNGALDAETGRKVFDVLRRRTAELADLSKRAGADVIGPILDKHPEVKEKLGGSYDELKKLAEKSGPEAQRVLTETTKQLKDAFSNGFDEKSIAKAKEAITNASSQIQKMAGDAGSGAKDAWEKSLKQAQPYLDKVPDIKQLLTEKSAVLMGSGAGAKEIWSRLKEMGEQKGGASKDKIEEVKNFINEKVAEAESGGTGGAWDKLQEFVDNIPGLDKMAEMQPQLKDFVVVLKENSDEAKQLAEETSSEIITLLKEKAEKAKKISQKAKEDTKDAAKDTKDAAKGKK